MTSWEIATVAAASTLALAGVVAALRHASARQPGLLAFFEENGLRVERAVGESALKPVAHISIFGGTPRTHAWTASGRFRGMPLTAVAYHERGGPRAAVTAFTAYCTPAPRGWPDVSFDPAVMRSLRPTLGDPELGGGPATLQIDHHAHPLLIESPDPEAARSAIALDLLEFLRRFCRPFLWWRVGAGTLAAVIPGHALRIATAEEVLGALRGFRALMDRPPRAARETHA